MTVSRLIFVPFIDLFVLLSDIWCHIIIFFSCAAISVSYTHLGAKSNDGYHNQKTGFCSYFLIFDDGARIEIMHIPKLADLPDVYKRQYIPG